MARTSIRTHASPERVFDVLTDAEAYARWVVGAKQVRGVRSTRVGPTGDRLSSFGRRVRPS